MFRIEVAILIWNASRSSLMHLQLIPATNESFSLNTTIYSIT